jgi:hypothetical protein
MAIGANSYGDTGEIAALVPRYANRVTAFDVDTRPTLAQVESLVDQVSAVVNSMLSQAGFSVPISQADAKLMLDYFVNEELAAIAEIVEDVQAFIDAHAVGIERLGAERSSDPVSGISFRDTDAGGDDTAPIFQRSAFGNAFTDWDT